MTAVASAVSVGADNHGDDTLSVLYSTSGTVIIDYAMDAGFLLDETQVYVGEGILPELAGEFTVAPGQYTEIHSNLGGVSNDGYLFDIEFDPQTETAPDIHVVAHAVVSGFD
ncbi:MAG: hypothetical protein BZY88_11565 [SAR202 cluster bacterium Io17-Chloro-G9]|nr:MAG: hypothetical protein BZY88_11565 [SAR202 cluster bacterium Io17-Chloro-G9]